MSPGSPTLNRPFLQKPPKHYGPLISLFGFVIVCTTIATSVYNHAIHRNGVNIAEAASVPLFAVLFAWVSFSFGTATLGFLHLLKNRRYSSAVNTQSVESTSRTAILMPVYNESPLGVFAGLQATIDSLRETGQAERFDVFVLSDTRDPEVWLEEERTWSLVATNYIDGPKIYYRHRYQNTSRKAGNIEDFCKRWGALYDYMLVLDADSVMSGPTVVEMVRRMDADPEMGILQVPPVPVNRLSVFARLQQFASRVYGPIFVKGLSSWAQRYGNYWGHNAIIRIQPFMNHCRLPILPGVAPLGGEILSHDFVEAALMVRAGWKVEIAEDLEGSFEECPTTFLDAVKRDQRWCQGNLQHARLTACEGFLAFSRLHFTIGVMSYVSSLLWMIFLVLSLTGAAWEHQSIESTFGAETLALFAVSMGMLLLPKVYGLIAVAIHPRPIAEYGGWFRLIGSVLFETLLSILLAPLTAYYHARFVLAILMGRKVEWDSQQREDCGVPLKAAFREHWKQTAFGLILLGGLIAFLPSLIAWFAPIYVGLIGAIPLVMFLGSPRIGRAILRQGLLTTPDETNPAPVLQRSRELHQTFRIGPMATEGECLFERLLRDSTFRQLHVKVLEQTRSSVPVSEGQRLKLQETLQTAGANAVSKEDRYAVLSDAETLKQLD